MMNTRIVVCGEAEAQRTDLIRLVTPEGTVPEAPDVAQSVIYETESADYIDCTVLPELGRDYISQIQEAVSADIDPASADTRDLLWYCLGAYIKTEEIAFLRNYNGRMIVVLTGCATMNAEQLEAYYSELENMGLDKKHLVVISVERKSGLTALMSRTLALLGKTSTTETAATTQSNESKEAESFILWAAGRAFCIAAIPLPLADVAPLVANEGYMFYKLGALYGYAVDETVLTGFLGCLGASVGGKLLASFLPFLKAPIAAGMTYAVGKAAQAYFESGMTLDSESLKDAFNKAKDKAKSMKWN